MSSHTDEETYTKAQMREAWQEAADDTMSHTRPTFAAFMAELNKSAIHPKCPVMVDGWPAEDVDNAVAYFGVCDHAATNIRVLILAETVTQMLIDIFHGYDKESHTLEEVLRDMKAEIADYRLNGPDCIDGGTDGS